jgi:hypothetical protein
MSHPFGPKPSDLKGLSPDIAADNQTISALDLSSFHFNRTLSILLADPQTRKLGLICQRCDDKNKQFGIRQRSLCGKLIHPSCRKTFISDQVTSAQLTFKPFREEHMHFVTILLALKSRLVPAPELRNVLDPNSQIHPSDKVIRTHVNGLIRDARNKVDLAFRSIKPTLFVARGAFEFEVIDRATAGKQKLRFLQDALREPNATEWSSCPDPILLHLHALVVVHGKDRFFTGVEISEALGQFFPHRHQVVVEPLGVKYSRAKAIMKRISYPLKTFTDFTPDRALEIARVVSITGGNALLYRRTWHARGTSPKATSQGIHGSGRPMPRPSDSVLAGHRKARRRSKSKAKS